MTNTILDKLLSLSPRLDEKKIFYFYSDHFKKVETLTLKELLESTEKIAAFLAGQFQEQSTVSIVFPPGLQLIQAFIGCMRANLIPVITYPPTNKVATQHYLSVIQDANPSVILCEANLVEKMKEINYTSTIISFEETLKTTLPLMRVSKYQDIAFLQYTSGSTKNPRGVVITHENLISNLECMKNYCAVEEKSKIVSWLPPYHDMGLVGVIFGVVLNLGAEGHLFSPETFIRDPLSWVQLISRTRATHCISPNFGYELVAKKGKEKGISNLDLSCLKYAGTGSEPVRAETLRTFKDIFKDTHFNDIAFTPCYGLAENTLMATCVQVASPYKSIYLRKDSAINEKVKIDSKPSKDTLEIVSCGKPCCKLLCIDTEKNQECAEDIIGEIFISGNSVAKEYWHRDRETQETFVTREDGLRYLKTGDLGFIHQGELYITGRVKDLIIIAGKNFYPHDIEFSVSSAINNPAVIAYSEESNNRENLTIVYGYRKQLNIEEFKDLSSKIVETILKEFHLPVHKIHFVHHKEILHTPSGKPRRQLIKKNILEGKTIPSYSFEHLQENLAKASSFTKEDVRKILIEKLRYVLGLTDSSKIDFDKPFSELGLDSLVAVEYFDVVESSLSQNFNLQKDKLFDARDINHLLDIIWNHIHHIASNQKEEDLFDKCKSGGHFSEIRSKEHEGYFVSPILEGPVNHHMKFRGKEKIIWSVNNYLSLANDERIKQECLKACEKYGPDYPMGARLLSGETKITKKFEKELATFLQKEAGLLFSFGYMGSMGIIDALIGNNDYLVIDQATHACIVDGARIATYESKKLNVFRHNDMNHLEEILSNIRKTHKGGILIAVDGVYGMLGTLAPLQEICKLKSKYKARLFVDDAHGFGVTGKNGRGTGEHFGVQDQVDIYYTTFAKSLANIGGVAAASEEVIDFIKWNARTYVFTRALPLINIVANQQAFYLMLNEPERRLRVWEVSKNLKKGLLDAGYFLASNQSPITPVLISNSNLELGLKILYELREVYNIFVSAVMYPVVPKDKMLFRLIPTANHTNEDVERTIEAFRAVRKKYIFTSESDSQDIQENFSKS